MTSNMGNKKYLCLLKYDQVLRNIILNNSIRFCKTQSGFSNYNGQAWISSLVCISLLNNLIGVIEIFPSLFGCGDKLVKIEFVKFKDLFSVLVLVMGHLFSVAGF